MTSFFQTFKTLTLAIILSIGISYAYAAWAPPTQAPTGGNAEAPVNVGSATQVKGGGFGVSGLFTAFSGIKIGNSAASCSSASDVGVIKNTGTDLEGCVGSSGSYSWKSLTAIGGGGGGGGGPTSPPTVNITVSDAQIPVEYSTTLSWTSTDASSGCTASGAWSGYRSASDTLVITPGSGTHTYTITCSNPLGSATDSITVDVRPWQTVSGYGNLGESCTSWLSRTNQAGVDGSVPRIYIPSNGYISMDACAYDNTYKSGDEYAPAFGADCTTFRPYTTGGITPIGTCTTGILTQTRR